MSALTRMRTLAAVCALVCFLAANVLAGAPGKPIDQDTPEPRPQEVGEPDIGHNLTWDRLKILFIVATQSDPTLRRIGLLLPTRKLMSGSTYRPRGSGR